MTPTGPPGQDHPSPQKNAGLVARGLAGGVAVILALGMAYSVITLRREADDLRTAEVAAARVMDGTSELNALVWEVIASPDASEGAMDRIRVVSEERAADMHLVDDLDGDEGGIATLPAAVRDHEIAIENVVDLSATGRSDAARVSARTQLADSSEELHARAEAVQQDLQDRAGKAYNTADIESVLMMLFGAVVAGLLFRKFDGAKRAGELKAARERAHSETRFRSLVQNSSDVITVIEADMTIRYQSPSIERVLGYGPDQLVGTKLADLIHADDLPTVSDFHKDFILGPDGESSRIEYRLLHADGSYRHVDNVRTNLLDDPDVRGVVINSRDITENKESADALRDSEARMRFIVEHVPSVVYTAEVGPHGRWLYVSPQIEGLLGFTTEEWMSDPQRWLKQLHPDDRNAVLGDEEAMLLSSEDRSTANEYRMLTRDGRMIWVNDDATVIRNEDGEPLYWSGVLSEVTDRKELELQLQHQAFHDSLTGLANRALFTDRVEHALQRAQRGGEQVAVLFLDLDDFKTVNDSLGHEAGDELLVAVADRLRRSLRPADTIARLGGDEFAVLLEAENIAGASSIAERMVRAIEEPINVGDRQVTVHASVGIELGDSRGHTAGDLLRNADVAMYVAKGKGKACLEVFDSSMHAAAVQRLELRADLQRALDEDEFVVHYQPIVGLQESGIHGMEALVRWQHPTRGVVPPMEFIPAAEETGLIVPIGRWVLEEAVQQAKKWQEVGPQGDALTMSVNVSARQLMSSGIVDEVASVLRKSGIPPQTLILEITESVLMNDSAAIPRLQQLRELGVRVAVDDFGTGYSSLGYLSSLPIDILKIDKSFIDQVAAGSEDSAIAKAVIKLGNSLSLTVVAEGIEDADQATVLKDMRCHRGQGFYFSKPLDATQVDELFLQLAMDPSWPASLPMDPPARDPYGADDSGLSDPAVAK